MIRRVKKLLQEARSLRSSAEARQATIALVRITLQHACISLAEWSIQARRISAANSVNLVPLPLGKLRNPSDGTLVSVLAELLVAAENDGWNGVSRPFWQVVDSSRPCVRLSRSGTATLEKVLEGFVRSRNDGVEGHGIPSSSFPEVELDVVELIVEKLSHVLPNMTSPNGDLVIEIADGTPYTLKLLRMYGTDLICYRRIQKSIARKCIVQAQRQTSLFGREEVVYETEDILNTPDINNYSQYELWRSYDEYWSPFALIPERLTDHFTGREKELNELSDWADDLESRTCMLFGDGGIGKTTLAVEFLHRVLEGQIRTKWRPELITFYTAKQTRWGLRGLEIIRVREVGVVDTVVAIVRALESKPLEREWFNRDTDTVIQQLASYLQGWGIDRNSHLLILDNTETMATNEEDIRALAYQIRELSRKIGRVLLTSRRREAIEAQPIEIKPLDEEESVRFLRARATALNRQPILQAGISTVRQYARRLGNKPLVLEVFIQALGEHSISLERAYDRVLRMLRQDLGEFLYTDAWNRMSDSMRHLLLLMTRVTDLHDELLLKLCCLQVGVTVIEANEVLEESRGIASLSRINGHLQIAFSSEFMKYCENRTLHIGGVVCPTSNSVSTVRRRYREFLKSVPVKIHDRVSRAYRHVYARAAWLAYQEERFDECELFYEEAIIADRTNGWLFDRYAYFLFSQQRLSEALEKSTRATQLIDEDPDSWFTRGMIEARLGRTRQAINSLNKAMENGKEFHLCLLQKAYAYLNNTPPDEASASECLEMSKGKTPENDPYRWKHMEELRSVQNRIIHMQQEAGITRQ